MRTKHGYVNLKRFFYLITATIVLRDMMVEVRINNDKTERIDFFDEIETCCESVQDDDNRSVGEDCSVSDMLVGNFDISLHQAKISYI